MYRDPSYLTSRVTVFMLVLTIFLFGSESGSLAESPERPNILFILVDDLGYADLGCFGGKAIQTPQLDRMAAEGMRFTNAYSGCTVCAPARSVLMTGMHMGHTSVRHNSGGVALRDEDVTIAEVLKPAGYVCGGFGKWGLGDLDTTGVPEKQGFDVFYGYYHQIHAHYFYPDYLIRNGRKVPLPGNKGFYEKHKGQGFFPTHDSETGQKRQFTHYLIFEETKKFIRKNKGRPFFCYAAWTPPHDRYEMPAEDPAVALYRDKDWPLKAKVIAAMDTMIDRQVGELLILLKELKIDRKTLVIFCSDNGTADRLEGIHDSSGPLRGRKRDMYEGGLRTPLIAYWPGRIKPGTVSDLPTYFPDVMPTLAELGGAQDHLPTEIDGFSIVPTLLGEKVVGRVQEKHEVLYWEWQKYDWNLMKPIPTGLMQAARRGNYKLLRYAQDKPWELYDLSKDIGEQNNIASLHPEVISRITSWIDTNRTEPRPQVEPEKPQGKRFR